MWTVFPTQILLTAMQQTLRWQLIIPLCNLNVSVKHNNCDCSPGFSNTDLKVSYVPFIFSYRAESDTMFFAMTTPIVLIFAVRTKAQRFSSPSKSIAERCMHFTVCWFAAKFSPIKIYKRSDHSHYCDGKANNVILSHGCSLYISL